MAAIPLTKTTGEEISLGLEYIVEGYGSGSTTTIITRNDAGAYEVVGNPTAIVQLNNSLFSYTDDKGQSRFVNKARIRRVVPRSDGSTTIVLDTEESRHTPSLYADISEELGTSGGDSINLGDTILFVSKKGDRSTAVKGSLSKTWEHPLYARDDAAPGDTIVVYPGTYTIGTGLDFDGTDSQLNIPAGLITYYFMPGVIMEWKENASRAMFRGRTGADTQVFVHGYLQAVFDGSTRFVDNRDFVSTVFCEMESLDIYNNEAAAFGNVDQSIYFYLKMKRLTKHSGGGAFGWETSNLDNSFVHVEIQDADYGDQSNIVSMFDVALTGATHTEKYDNLDINITTNYWYDFNGSVTLTDLHYRFIVTGRCIVQSSNNSCDEFIRRANGAITMLGSTMLFDIAHGEFHMALWREFASMIFDGDSSLTFQGNYKSTNQKSPIKGMFDFVGTGHRLVFDGKFQNDFLNPVIYLDAGPTSLFITGEIFANVDSEAIKFGSTPPAVGHDIVFQNAQFKNTVGTTPLISASVPINITTAGLYYSNATATANVTYIKLYEPV